MARSVVESKLRVSESADALHVRWRTGSNGIGCFFLFWMTGWTGGCALIGRVAWADPSFLNVVGAAVFWTGWVFGLMMLVQQFIGRETVSLSSDGLTATQGRIFRHRRRIPLDEIVGFYTADESDGRSHHEATMKKLEVRTVGRPIRMGQGLSADDVRQLATTLRNEFKRRGYAKAVAASWPPLRELIVFRRGRTTKSPEVQIVYRSPGDAPLRPPSDSRMRCVDEFDAVQFSTRGKLYLSAVFGALLINLFWNGILGIFLYELFGGEPAARPTGLAWIERFVVLLPFESVGLVMLCGLLFVLLEPARVWSHRFGQTEVCDRLSWFGFGFSKRYSLGLLDRIEVRCVPYSVPKFPRRLPLASLWSPQGCPTYSLAPVELGNRDVGAIEGLTFGEACWMADVLIRRSDLPWTE